MRIFALSLLVAFMPLAAFADSVNVDAGNYDGIITASGGNSLTLSNSTLVSVNGFGLYNCGTGFPSGCSGSLTFTTGSQGFTGSLTATTGQASWTGGAGSSFMITSNPGGPGGAFTFTGSFSGANWTPQAGGLFWTFVGTIANGTLTDSLGTFTMIPGGTIDISTVDGGPANGVWTDGSGDTTITVPRGDIPQPVPELGTLTLLGSGLVVLGVFTRRRLSKKTTAPE
jgi:hypothetical protein